MERSSHHREGGWELFGHGPEIGVRGFGHSRELAFEEAAYALSAAITDPRGVRQHEVVDIVCNATSDDRLLLEWLNAVISEMRSRSMLFSRYAVQIHNHGLTARAWGEPLDPERHEPVVEVRSATDTDLSVARDTEGYWVAQCVVDV